MALDSSVGAPNDVDSLLAVVDHGSGVGSRTGNDGDNTLAVVDIPGSETNSIAPSNVWRPLNENYC